MSSKSGASVPDVVSITFNEVASAEPFEVRGIDVSVPRTKSAASPTYCDVVLVTTDDVN